MAISAWHTKRNRSQGVAFKVRWNHECQIGSLRDIHAPPGDSFKGPLVMEPEGVTGAKTKGIFSLTSVSSATTTYGYLTDKYQRRPGTM